MCLIDLRNRNDKVNYKRSFVDNLDLFLATRFVYNYTLYDAISVTNFFYIVTKIVTEMA